MDKSLRLAVCAVLALQFGCGESAAKGYIAASEISSDGFAKDAAIARELEGKDIRVWGFVDYRNMYGDEGARRILQEYWSGESRAPAFWSFHLMTEAHGQAGRSFQIRILNSSGRDELLRAFVANARAARPTKVYLEGRLSTFPAPINARTLTGLNMEVERSTDVLLAPPN